MDTQYISFVNLPDDGSIPPNSRVRITQTNTRYPCTQIVEGPLTGVQIESTWGDFVYTFDVGEYRVEVVGEVVDYTSLYSEDIQRYRSSIECRTRTVVEFL